MRLLIFLCVIATVAHGYHLPAPLNKDGTVADTHEVAVAKQEHYAKLEKAGGATPYNQAHYSSYNYASQEQNDHHQEDHHRYHGPPAPLNHDGTVAETPEVRHVKHERLAALAEAFAKAPKHDFHEDGHHIYKRSAYQPSTSHSSFVYRGPSAPLNHDGTVDETPEVKAAKATHFAAHSKAQQSISYAKSDEWSNQNQNEEDTHHVEYKYQGPPAPLNHDGTVAETPEVKHLKEARLTALAEAFAKAPRNYNDEDNHYNPKRSVQHQPSSGHYYGPPAPLNHDGTVAETEDVKTATAIHFAAHAKANQRSSYHSHTQQAPQTWSIGGSNQQQDNQIYHEQDNHRYHGPPAPLNHDGTVAETPEVKHIKEARLATLAEAFAKAPRHHQQENHHKMWKRSVEQYVPTSSSHYHGPPAPLNHDGTVAETEEVKAAKALHLEAHAKVYHVSPYPSLSQYTNQNWENSKSDEQSHDLRYHGPPAPLNHDGTVAETPEVQHVKQAHLAAVAEAFAKAPRHSHKEEQHHNIWKRSVQQYEPSYQSHYHGPPAPLNHDGTVDETDEVKVAKAIHFAAHAKAQHGAPRNSYNSHQTSAGWNNAINIQHENNHRYHGPPAPLNHDGTVADTPEVMHVKQERLAALAEAFAKAPRDHIIEGDHNVWKRSGSYLPSTPTHYHGPPAPLNHDGTVAETEEVKKAKAIHFAAYAKVNYAPSNSHDNHYNQGESNGYSTHHDNHRYHGPPAPLNHDGTVDETPEVKHVKAAHLAAVAEAFAKAPRHHNQEEESYEWQQPAQHSTHQYY